jgi:nicotinamide mononucleotide adenylyltransferase
MFEMVSNYIQCHTQFELVGGYLSPVSDAYQKTGLASGHHRVNMCLEAVESSSWIMVDAYETQKCNIDGEPEYVSTAMALQHFDYEINTILNGILAKDGTTKKAEIALLAGADLVMSMSMLLE